MLCMPTTARLAAVFARELRAALGKAGVDRPDLFASDQTRKPLTFHDPRATGLTWMAVRGDDPLKKRFPALPECLLGAETEGVSHRGFAHEPSKVAEQKCRRRESNPRPGAYETPALAD